MDLVRDMTNDEYHKKTTNFYSSSQLKVALEDIELFYRKYILKEEIEDEGPTSAFDIGSYYHTAILEPKKLSDEYVVWTGLRKSGKEWDSFKEQNSSKTILSKSELEQAETLIKATQRNKIAMDILKTGEPELAVFGVLNDVKIKIKMDWANIVKSKPSIMDLKSTTGNVRDTHKIKGKISSLNYDLSAALYVDTLSDFLKIPVKDFYWIFASKDNGTCCVYRATEQMLNVGRAKYRRALELIKFYESIGWKFEDRINDIDPASWEVEEWINKTEKNNNVEDCL